MVFLLGLKKVVLLIVKLISFSKGMLEGWLVICGFFVISYC